MAPRRKSVVDSHGIPNNVLNKENGYLRSLSDYQARVRRRESIRSCKNVAEYDLEQKIALESKIKEGSRRLLAAAQHPAQYLEASRTLFTSNKKMSAYMAELKHRRGDASSNTSVAENNGQLSVSDLRFPLMWRDSDHFKNRGDYRRFAVFCIVRVGAEVYDTSLMYPIDREQTDISFPDVLSFNNVPAEFELILEVYSHILQEDLSIASAPRRIRRSIHSSISKTVGKKFATSVRDVDEPGKTPKFDLVACAKMTLDDTDSNIRSHDLVLNSLESKVHVLPLFGHFCCRLAIQPHHVDREAYAGFVSLNDRRCWMRLRAFQIDAWISKKHFEQSKESTFTIPVNKETVIRRSKSWKNQLRIINHVHGSEKLDVLELNSTEDAQNWFERLTMCVGERVRLNEQAATSFQRIPYSENQNLNTGTTGRIGEKKERSKSLYDETPLTVSSLPMQRITISTEPFKFSPEYRDNASRLMRSSASLASTVPPKSHEQKP